MPILNNIRRFVWEEYAQPLLDLLFPPTCAVCGGEVASSHQMICTKCMLDAPLTYFWRKGHDSPMAERLQGMRPEIEAVVALLYFMPDNPWRDMIHRFKYSSKFGYGTMFGKWMGSELRESPNFAEVDCVVAIPLHPLRLLRRGYNQSDYIAQGVAESMGCTVIRDEVYRKRHNAAQASTERDRRWENVEDLFEVRNPKSFDGRNILLVDDVFTTGATILSCAEAILDAAPTCRIWIATFAVSMHEFATAR